MRKRINFSLIEIMLALGVCVVGICAVMVLFPIGANANRDAAMETYAANAADQMLHSLKYQLKNDSTAWTDLIGVAVDGSGGELPTTPDLALVYVPADLDNGTLWDDATTDQRNLFKHKTERGVYQMISHRLDTLLLNDIKIVPDKIDYRGLLQVWKEQISVQGNDLPYAFGVKLNVLVSWPPLVPPTARQKSYYSLEVFNVN